VNYILRTSIAQIICENLHSNPIDGAEAIILIEMAVCVTDGNIDPGSVPDVFRQFHFQVLRLTGRRDTEPPAQTFG
jgi:hypothetical protein